MLLRFAKIAGGLRLLITEAGLIVATSAGLLSARSVAYLVGFGLGSIVSSWLPIVALLVSITGFFGAGANTPECEADRAQMRAIDNANRAAIAAWQILNKAYIDGHYKNYLLQSQALAARSAASAKATCASFPESRIVLFVVVVVFKVLLVFLLLVRLAMSVRRKNLQGLTGV